MSATSFIIFAGDAEADGVAAALDAIDQPHRRLRRRSEVVSAVGSGAVKALIVAGEAIDGFDLGQFRAAVEQQPAWSDLPILLLVERADAARYADRLDALGQVRLIERPLDSFILRSAAQAAIRSRMRQAGARLLVEKLEASQRDHRLLSETLERKIAERTSQLETAYNRLVREAEERKAVEERLRESKAELIHVSRLSAMGALASTLAHELNQPLTAVTGYIQGSRRLLGRVDGAVIAQVQSALGAAEAGALRAGQIVRRLRELVARGNVAVKPELLGKLIVEACELAFVDQRLHGVTHRIATDEAVAMVEADRIQIQQVLINLVRNAVEALAGRLRREILIASRAIGPDMIEISVSDTGTGLSPERMAALFSPFDSSKEEGMGIGLSISRTIVEAHGGKIWAENNADEGATFRFTLPRAHASDQAGPDG